MLCILGGGAEHKFVSRDFEFRSLDRGLAGPRLASTVPHSAMVHAWRLDSTPRAPSRALYLCVHLSVLSPPTWGPGGNFGGRLHFPIEKEV